MTVIRSWAGEGLADGTTLTTGTAGTGDTTFDQVSGTWVVEAGGDGVARLRCDAAGVLTWGGLTATAGRSAYRAGYTYDVLPAGETDVMNLLATGGARAAKVQVRPTGQVLVRDSTNTNVGISTATIAAGVEYRFELAVQADLDTAQAYVTDVATETLVLQLDVAGTFDDPVNFKVDSNGGDRASHLAVADTDDLIGPWETPIPPPRPTVAWIGDSLAFRDDVPPFGSRETTTRGRIETAGWDPASIWWYAAGGKPITGDDQNNRDTRDDLAAADAALQGVDQAIIALGTNNVGDTDQQIVDAVNDVLDQAVALGVGEVVWRGIAYAAPNNPNAARVNPILRDTVEAHPGNARFADWAAYIHDGRDETGLWDPDDGSHMTATGYAVWDEYGITALQGDTPDPAPYMLEDGTVLQIRDDSGTSYTLVEG